MIEPLPSLLLREVSILARDSRKLADTCWELRRVLLLVRAEYDTLHVYQGKSGEENLRRPSLSDSSPSDPLGDLREGMTMNWLKPTDDEPPRPVTPVKKPAA